MAFFPRKKRYWNVNMAFPPYDDIIKVALEYLRKRGGHASSTEVSAAVASRFKLSEADLRKTRSHSVRPSGESLWKLTLRRVKFTLQQRGDLERPGVRGQWKLKS